jgi:hypothetical protein
MLWLMTNESSGADAGEQECINGVTNMNVQGADKASIQSADYQDMNLDDDGDTLMDWYARRSPQS